MSGLSYFLWVVQGTDLGLKFHKVSAKGGSRACHLGKMLFPCKLLPQGGEDRPHLGGSETNLSKVSGRLSIGLTP